MQPGRISGILGRALIGIGLIFLLFVAYLWWGTAITEAHSQAVLRSEYAAALRQAHPKTAPIATPPPGGSSHIPAIPAIPMAAPPNGQPVGLITIPEIGLNSVIVEGTDTAALRTGPGHYPGTPLPGEAGNVAIAGHRTTYARPFYNLDALKPGDPIHISTVQGSFTYSVVNTVIVSPDDVSVAAPTATPQLTLTTCNPRYSAATRMVVHASLTSAALAIATNGQATNPIVTPSSSSPNANSAAPTAASTSTPRSQWVDAIAWGLLVLLVALGTTKLTRLLRPSGLPITWLGGILGWVICLTTLYVFFNAISPLLPASL